MKIAGWIILVFGALSFLGCLIGGNSVFGPLVWIAIGAFCLYRAEQKKKDKDDKDKWTNQQ
ncbi:MAG: hypothetical protein ACFNUM_07500 [Segatella salivae]|jgi:lipoprotein